MHCTVCDFLLDLTQNSVEAGASRITVSVVEEQGQLEIEIADNGKGMDEATLARVRDPFFTDGVKHARRKVGLGIPFLIQALDQVGGWHELVSAPGVGTKFRFAFPLDNIDTPPLGDLPGFILSVMCFDGDYELAVERRDQARGVSYGITRSELVDAVGELTDAGALLLAREFLVSQEYDVSQEDGEQ